MTRGPLGLPVPAAVQWGGWPVPAIALRPSGMGKGSPRVITSAGGGTPNLGAGPVSFEASSFFGRASSINSQTARMVRSSLRICSACFSMFCLVTTA